MYGRRRNGFEGIKRVAQTDQRSAVPGMNCAMPKAPAWLTMVGSNPAFLRDHPIEKIRRKTVGGRPLA